MPKKFQGENTKSAAARARKAEAKAAADAKRQQELEDAYWKDDDKHVMRKEQRKVGGCRVAPEGRVTSCSLSQSCGSAHVAPHSALGQSSQCEQLLWELKEWSVGVSVSWVCD